MAQIYEFHVTGQVGEVIRSALPEMQTFEQTAGRTLRGITHDRDTIDRLLASMRSHDLTVHWLHISARPGRSALGEDVPVVDDGGPQHDVLQ